MTITHRRWLLISFSLIFLLVSPLIIVYASGYRYNTRLRRIEQVGLLSLSTQQNNTEIRIDDEIYGNKSTSLTKTLPPRDYAITIRKAGYHDWQKTLPIYEGQTTFSHNIRLFAQADPQPIELFTNPLTLLAKNESSSLYASDLSLIQYQAETGAITETELPIPNVAPQSVQLWQNDSAIFTQNNTWYRAVFSAEEIKIEPLILPAGTTKAYLFESTILAISDDRVWEWRSGTLTPLFAIPDIQSIAIEGNRYLVLAAEATQKRSFLYEVADAGARPVFVTSLSYSETWRLQEPRGTLWMAFDETQARLTFIDTRVSPAQTVTLEGVFTWHWSDDQSSLLTATSNELAIYHLDNGITQELLLRQSDPITDVAWVVGMDWVLFTSTHALYALERDERDQRNTILLAHNKTQPRIVDVADEFVRFSSQEQSSFVLWELPLIAD